MLAVVVDWRCSFSWRNTPTYQWITEWRRSSAQRARLRYLIRISIQNHRLCLQNQKLALMQL